MTRPAPKFHVSPDNFGESVSVECDLCASTEEWPDPPVEIGDLTKWVAEHRMTHIDAWEAQQREAGQVYHAHYSQYHSEYKDEFFDPIEAAQFLEYGSDNGDLSAHGVIMPDGTEVDSYDVLAKHAKASSATHADAEVQHG